MLKYFLILAVLSGASFSFAENELKKEPTLWATNYSDTNNSRWFLLAYQGEDQYTLNLCAGFKCIPYPGFWRPFDIFNDERIKWISTTSMEVSNDDKDAGWPGYITFNKCII